MSHLPDLPNEILDSILMYLSDTDYARLSLVNKRLHAVVAPILDCRWPTGRWWHPYNQNRDESVEVLALGLLRRPELRRHVRKVTIPYLSTRNNHLNTTSSFGESSKLTPTDLEHMSEAAAQIFPAFAKATDWVEQVNGCIADAILVLVLSWARHITHLDLSLPGFSPEDRHLFVSRWMAQLIRHRTPDTNPLPLAKLQWVRLYCDDMGGAEAKHAAPFFHLPQVKSFVASGLRWFDWQEEDEDEQEEQEEQSYDKDRYTEFPSGTSTIEELILENTNVFIDGLVAIMGACRRLKTLGLHFSCLFGSNAMDWHEIMNAIQRHGDSLESLDFDLSNTTFDLFNLPMVDSASFDECFRHLRCLTHLTINIFHLFNGDHNEDDPNMVFTNTLPSSIRRLNLNPNNSSWEWSLERNRNKIPAYLPGLTELLRECRPDGRYPHLKQLNLISALVDDAFLSSTAELRTLATRNGVELSFEKRWD